MPNAVNEPPPTKHYNLRITAHIAVTDSNNITVTVLGKANHRALHSRRGTVTPFSQQSQLERHAKIRSLFTVICRYLSCIRTCLSDVSFQRGEGWDARDRGMISDSLWKITHTLIRTVSNSLFPYLMQLHEALALDLG